MLLVHLHGFRFNSEVFDILRASGPIIFKRCNHHQKRICWHNVVLDGHGLCARRSQAKWHTKAHSIHSMHSCCPLSKLVSVLPTQGSVKSETTTSISSSTFLNVCEEHRSPSVLVLVFYCTDTHIYVFPLAIALFILFIIQKNSETFWQSSSSHCQYKIVKVYRTETRWDPYPLYTICIYLNSGCSGARGVTVQ